MNGYRDRLIKPFYSKKQIVGYTCRKVKEGKPKYVSEQQPGYVFNLDAQYNRVYTVVVEGPFDAIAVEGVALLGNEIKEQQALQINSLNTKVIVVSDRDEAGQNIPTQAIDLGWGVSMPAWDDDIKDVNEAVQRYGKLYTLHTIIGYAEFNELKIKLGAKKWLPLKDLWNMITFPKYYIEYFKDKKRKRDLDKKIKELQKRDPFIHK